MGISPEVHWEFLGKFPIYFINPIIQGTLDNSTTPMKIRSNTYLRIHSTIPLKIEIDNNLHNVLTFGNPFEIYFNVNGISDKSPGGIPERIPDDVPKFQDKFFNEFRKEFLKESLDEDCGNLEEFLK